MEVNISAWLVLVEVRTELCIYLKLHDFIIEMSDEVTVNGSAEKTKKIVMIKK